MKGQRMRAHLLYWDESNAACRCREHVEHVAQLVEQRSFKPEVLGSNPSMVSGFCLVFTLIF